MVLRPWDFRVREFRRGNQAFRFSAQVNHHAMFRVRDNLDFDYFVRCSRFLLFVVLLQQFAHFFRAGGFFIGVGRFGIRRMRLMVCLSRGMSGRGIGGRGCPLRRSRCGRFRGRGRSSLFGRAFYR